MPAILRTLHIRQHIGTTVFQIYLRNRRIAGLTPSLVEFFGTAYFYPSTLSTRTIKAIRLAVGSPIDRRSGVWRFWTNKKGDIYVAVRCLGGILKVSLHKDGNCHFGFTTEYKTRAADRFGITSRHIEKWRLPDTPIVRALKIVIPESELRSNELRDSEGVHWLKAPTAGSFGTIALFIANNELDVQLDVGTAEVLMWEIRTAIRKAIVTYATSPVDNDLSKIIAVEKQKLLDLSKSHSRVTHGRAIIADTGTHFDRTLLDLAV